jgi:hypothetical protein
MSQRAELKKRYLKTFEMLIDAAFKGKPQPFMFCDGVVLELYEKDDELHWRVYGGNNSRSSEQDG